MTNSHPTSNFLKMVSHGPHLGSGIIYLYFKFKCITTELCFVPEFTDTNIFLFNYLNLCFALCLANCYAISRLKIFRWILIRSM